MRPGGTNLLDSGVLRLCSQTPYPYDAYQRKGAGAGAGPGFRGSGPFISSFRSSFRFATSPPSLVDRREAILRVPLRPSA
jgi:hypothetical protein